MSNRVSPVVLVCGAAFGGLILCGGCPAPGAAVIAQISVSTTQGSAPLHVVVSAEQSTSRNGAIAKVQWDFAGEAESTDVVAEHTFSNPGRYVITLMVEDETGEQDRTAVTVRVAGGPVTAVIDANPTSGAAPLEVQFDGTASTAEDDVVFDYFWDFGDGGTSRRSAPMHTYTRAGTFTVELRAVSAGGVDGTAQVEITVADGGSGSLQFSGGQFATLPVSAASALTAFTFEAWCRPESDGGGVVSFGSPSVALLLLPSANAVQLRSGNTTLSDSVFNTAGRWRHYAITYRDGEGAKVYVDGGEVSSGGLSGSFTVDALTLGAGYRGNIARVVFWADARTAAEIAADIDSAPTGSEADLLGYWSLSERAGQTLGNAASGGAPGTLGASSSSETSDPAWSSDGP